MSIQIAIDDDIYKQFQAALLLTGEEEQNVLSELMIEYAHKQFQSVIGNTVASNTNENNQVGEDRITEQKQKQLFVSWFRGLTWNGKPYNPVTISGYVGRIESACNDPSFSTVPIKNLFAVTDLTQFIDIQTQIKSCEGYSVFDAKSHNGFTAALKKYEDFLKFQAYGNYIQPSQTASRPYRTSNVHRWTMIEDEICCKRFLENYVVNKSSMDTVQFLQMLTKEVPDVSEGSLRMKIQNIKYLTVQAGLKDTSKLKWLKQYSSQCEKAFKKALIELGL